MADTNWRVVGTTSSIAKPRAGRPRLTSRYFEYVRKMNRALLIVSLALCAGCPGPTPGTAVPKEIEVIDAVDKQPLRDVDVTLNGSVNTPGIPTMHARFRTGADGRIPVTTLKTNWWYQFLFIKPGYNLAFLGNGNSEWSLFSEPDTRVVWVSATAPGLELQIPLYRCIPPANPSTHP
jgi:hypothetical protein